ncbi:MAG: putative metalloprotease CJM1_0395 family protein [Pseudomonadota bacterium]
MTDGVSLSAGAESALTQAGNERRVEQQQQLMLQQEIRQLASRDREVRAHEQAHAAVGGRYAGAPRDELERGPNGVPYAVAGSVSIDVAPVPNDPAATLAKMTVVQRAAMAPAQPSAADRAIAAKAASQASQARAELAAERSAQHGAEGAGLDAVDQAAGNDAASTDSSLVIDTRGGSINTRA